MLYRSSFLNVPIILVILISNLIAFSKIKQKTNTTKNQIALITEALDNYRKQKPFELSKNPLREEVDFSHYTSRTYLYFYRALGFYFESLSLKKQNNLRKEEISLKRTLDNLEKTLSSPYHNKEKIKLWKSKALLSLIDVYDRKNDPAKTISYVYEYLDTIEQSTSNRILDYLFVSFLKQKAKKKAIQILEKNQSYFSRELTSKRLTPYKELIETELVRLKAKDKKKTYGIRDSFTTESSIIKNVALIFEKAKKYYYSDKMSHELSLITRIYPKIKVKEKRALKEKYFLRAVEKNFSLLSLDHKLQIINILWDKSKLTLALFVLDNSLKQHQGDPLYPKLLFIKSRLYEDSKKYKTAQKFFDQLVEISSGTKYHELALYRKALIEHISIKKNPLKFFNDYLKHHPNGNYNTAANYYSLFYETKGKKQLTKKTEDKISRFFQKNPINYYSFLLAKKHPHLYQTVFEKLMDKQAQLNLKINNKESLDYKILNHIKAFSELKELELYEEAHEILAKIETGSSDMSTQLFLLEAFKKTNKLDKVVINSMRMFNNNPAGRDLINLQDIFPLSNKTIIENVLKDYKIESLKTFFILSLIRQESAFNPLAISSANAKGLMQMLPSTAKEVATKNKLKNYSLENPEDNLTLGINYLSHLLKKFDGNKVHALSSYNAGPTATKRWLKYRSHLSTEDFIETIPYKETSLYIKLIMRNFMVYQLLYQDKDINKVNFLF